MPTFLEQAEPVIQRVGAIGDVHEEDEALEGVLEFFAQQELDLVVCVGDIVDGPGDGARCCELLEKHGVHTVSGNHDRWFVNGSADSVLSVKGEEFVRGLPKTRSYETPGGPLLLCHGLGENDMNRLREDDYGYALEANDELQALLRSREYRYVINGHSHHRMVRDFGGLTVINVGTIFREHEPCCALLDFAGASATFYDLENSRPNPASADRRSLG